MMCLETHCFNPILDCMQLCCADKKHGCNTRCIHRHRHTHTHAGDSGLLQVRTHIFMRAKKKKNMNGAMIAPHTHTDTHTPSR